MYAEFFGFRELPFNNTPDPRFFYSTPDHEEALATLIYTIRERKGFVLLTGETGTGKTLVTRLMLRHFGTRLAFAMLHHSVRTPEDLLESICTEFELETSEGATGTQLVRTLHDYLLTQFARNVPVVLVLDEAQNLSIEGFEQLRQIGNLEADDVKLLQIIIVGQPELQKLFASPQVRQLRQRLFRSFHLPALTREHTEKYILHRLAVVTDRPDEVFDAQAMEAIYRYSEGLPRLINTICDNALLSAYASDRRDINAELIAAVGDSVLSAGSIGGVNHPDAAAWSDSDGARMERAEAATAAPCARESTEARATRSLPSDADCGMRAHGAVRRLRDAVSGANRRIGTLERRGWITPELVLDAQTVKASLVPLIRDSRALTAKAEATTGLLRQREETLSRLAQTLRGMIHDLRELFDRATETTTRTLEAERRARSVLGELHRHTPERSETIASLPQGNGGIPFPADPARSSPPVRRFEGAALSACGTETLLHRLREARASLAGLRAINHDPAGDSTAVQVEIVPAATSRLAASVDLLMHEVSGTHSE
jgi:type II secretory pathway predicted ATPase ExeA